MTDLTHAETGEPRERPATLDDMRRSWPDKDDDTLITAAAVMREVGALSVVTTEHVDHEGRSEDGKSITCPTCGRTSHNPTAVAEGYCGACKDWTTGRTRTRLVTKPPVDDQPPAHQVFITGCPEPLEVLVRPEGGEPYRSSIVPRGMLFDVEVGKLPEVAEWPPSLTLVPVRPVDPTTRGEAVIPEKYSANLRELFPLTAHGYSHREFVGRWHGFMQAFADRPFHDPIPGWPNLMDFSGALLALKTGAHLARESWSRSPGRPGGPCHGRYVALQIGYPGGIAVNQNTADATGLPLNSIAAFEPYLIQVMPPSDNRRRHGVEYPGGAPVFAPYAAGADDLLAEDWMVVCRPDDPPHEPADAGDEHHVERRR